MEIWEKIKQHPYLVAALAGVIIIFVLVLHSRSSGSSSGATSGIDPTTAQLYAQNQQITAQATMQANALDAAAQHDTTLASYGLSLAQIQGNTAITEQNTAAGVSMAQIAANTDVQKQGIAANLQGLQLQAGVQQSAIEAQLKGLESNNNTTLGIAQLSAQEQVDIAGISSQTQMNLANTNAQVALGTSNINAATQIAISNNQAQVSIAQSNNQTSLGKTQSGNNLMGSVISGVASLAAAFL